MTTVNHAWTNLSLQTARNSIVDIADDLRPVLSEKIDLAGAKIIIAATKLSAGVAKATRDFTNSKDRKAPVPESRSGHSKVQKHAESDWQPMPHAFSATNTLATPNLHAVESNAAENRIGGSLMGLEGPHSKEADEVKAPSYKSSSAHRATNKDRRMEKETGEGRKPRAQRNARRKDDGFKNQSLTSLGEKNEV